MPISIALARILEAFAEAAERMHNANKETFYHPDYGNMSGIIEPFSVSYTDPFTFEEWWIHQHMIVPAGELEMIVTFAKARG